MKEKVFGFENDIASWDKVEFIKEVSVYLEKINNTSQDKAMVLMLAEAIDTFVVATAELNKQGLVVVHSNGVSGKNHYFEIRDKALSKIVILMTELGLTPKRRKPFPSKREEVLDAFMKGPTYFAEFKASQTNSELTKLDLI